MSAGASTSDAGGPAELGGPARACGARDWDLPPPRAPASTPARALTPDPAAGHARAAIPASGPAPTPTMDTTPYVWGTPPAPTRMFSDIVAKRKLSPENHPKINRAL